MAKEKQDDKGITVKKHEDMPEWYSQVVLKSGMAEHAPVRGCMVIRPLGYAVWEAIQNHFNKILTKEGVDNAYFPLFIPESYFTKEAKHVEGFAPELAWLEKKDDQEERLAVRPTSETIIHDSFSRWIRSHRDLPLQVNQWANVVRWEVSQTKIFLRTREFLWQEGHCAYATADECQVQTEKWLRIYHKMCEDLLAIPCIMGPKSKAETFPGADKTYAIESFMPDGKALQAGTSHNLGQNFSKAFNIAFIGDDEQEHIPYLNSWGVSTRLLGAMVMLHSDNKGLVLPPRVAKRKAVIIPLLFGKDSDTKVIHQAEHLKEVLAEFMPVIDDSDLHSPGYKYAEWEMKGMPLRIEVGPKDVAEKQCVIVRRDTGEKQFVKLADVKEVVAQQLDEMHNNLLAQARKHFDERKARTDDWDEFKRLVAEGKMVLAPFCDDEDVEAEIKEETGGVTTRVTPIEGGEAVEGAKCVKSGKPATRLFYFSKSY